MRSSAAKPRWWRRLLLVAVAVGALWFLVVILGVLSAASQQELHPSDAIVVFGAAEYSGRPSPVYRARLDHAYDLFRRGLAPVIITTGGAGADPSFSEGGVGHDYLMRRGISDSTTSPSATFCPGTPNPSFLKPFSGSAATSRRSFTRISILY